MIGSNLKAGEYAARYYTDGRSGNKIQAITIHHMAAVLTAKECVQSWLNGDRQSSSHYGIGRDGVILQYVDENNTAWTNSNWDSNCKSVTIETSNSATGGDWPISDNVLNVLIKLVADIAKRNGLGNLVKGVNLTWHSMFTSTDCPGNYLRNKLDYIIAEANKINEQNNLIIEDITNKQVVLNKDCSMWDLTFTKWADAKSVKEFAKGTTLEISAIATHPLGGKYYLTEYSFSNKVENGFNINDCDDVVIVTEPETPIEEPINYETKYNEEVARNTELFKQIETLNGNISASNEKLNANIEENAIKMAELNTAIATLNLAIETDRAKINALNSTIVEKDNMISNLTNQLLTDYVYKQVWKFNLYYKSKIK